MTEPYHAPPDPAVARAEEIEALAPNAKPAGDEAETTQGATNLAEGADTAETTYPDVKVRAMAGQSLAGHATLRALKTYTLPRTPDVEARIAAGFLQVIG